jgi:hypothetical protein
MALFALATFLLSACNWAIQEHVSGLCARSADSGFITRIVIRVGNRHIQGLCKSIHALASSCPWNLPCLRMLFLAAAT